MNQKQSSFDQSRRDFVKKSSLLASGAIAAPFLSRTNFFSGADNTIKIALIGCGGRGTRPPRPAPSPKKKMELLTMADALPHPVDGSPKKNLDRPGDKKKRGKGK